MGLCPLPTTPLFFQMDKRRTEKFRSTDLKPCNILVRQEETRSKRDLFITEEVLVLSTFVPEVLVSLQELQTSKLFLIQTHHLIQNN